MFETGFIQYRIDWKQGPPLEEDAIRDLIEWRQKLLSANLVGVDPSGIGFGNISTRLGRGFAISGTQTGHLAELGPEHVSLVTSFDIANNELACVGPVKASSEALSHAIFYEQADRIGAVVHVHDNVTWEHQLGRLPTTPEDAEAGTVRMAEAIAAVLRTMPESGSGVIVMGGHRDGLLSFGRSLEEAGHAMLEACSKKL